MANIQVDVYTLRNAIKEAIDYVQGTNVIGIVFHFRDFDIPSGVSAKVYVKKPSGKAVYNTATINGNDINLKVTDQMFSETGITKLQVQITNGSSDLVSFVQPVIVHENNVAGDVPESKNESNFLDEYIQEMESATSAANTATNNANNAATAANNALESIEEAVQGTIINDTTPSVNTTYSGNKIDDMAKVNLFNLGEAVNFHGATHTVNGNKITVKYSSQGTASPHLQLRFRNLKPNSYYYISYISTRTGENGGGIAVGYHSNSSFHDLERYASVLNGNFSFKTPDRCDYINVNLYAGIYPNVSINDSATFEVMLIEGTEYAPIMYNSRDIAKLATTVNNRTLINLFDYSGILFTRCTGSVSGTTISATINNLDATPSAYKIFDNFKKNTNYTLSLKSTRTGDYGGGVIISDFTDNKFGTNILNVQNTINTLLTFNTSDYEKIAIRFVIGQINSTSEIGDSATFTDIMLVEGEFAPGEYVPYIGADTFSDAIAGIKTTNTEMATNILQNATDISGLQMDMTDTKKEIETVDNKISDYKLLWSGNYWPDDTQTCTLSEKVSEQKNGIILWFSVYNEGETSDNTGWFPYYVHKSIFKVKQNLGVSNGAGFCVPVVASGSFGTVATKYIYVYDTYVTGSASNKGKGTGKVEYNNRYWSLKAIVGW